MIEISHSFCDDRYFSPILKTRIVRKLARHVMEERPVQLNGLLECVLIFSCALSDEGRIGAEYHANLQTSLLSPERTPIMYFSHVNHE